MNYVADVAGTQRIEPPVKASRYSVVDRAAVVWTIIAIGAALLPHIRFAPLWSLTLVTFVSCWRLAVAWRNWPLPGRITRLLLAITCFAAVATSYRAISGLDAGNALLITMLAMKVTESGRKRDLIVLVFLAYFLLVTLFLYSQSVWTFVYGVPALWLITTALWQVSQTTRPTPAGRALRAAGVQLLLALPLMLVLFMLFPRVPGPFWSLPAGRGATTGLSDEMSPGDIAQLLESPAVAFRAQFDGLAPPARDLYWRALVLNRFDGRTWRARRQAAFAPTVVGLGESTAYQVTLEPHQRRWLFALDMPTAPNEALRRGLILDSELQLTRARPVDKLFRYSLQSHLAHVAEPQLTRLHRQRQTMIPAQRNPRAQAFARELRSTAGDDQDFLSVLLQHFREQPFFYTRSPRPLDRIHPIDMFLFDTREGFCEHYASAFTLMARAAGVPARVVTGYQGGEFNPLTSQVTVRQSDAHAWSEVWLPRRGWVRYDPTAAVAPERVLRGVGDALGGADALPSLILSNNRLLTSLRLRMDALNVGWNEWVLGYNRARQNSFLNWLGMPEPGTQQLVLLLTGVAAGFMLSLWLWVNWRSQPRPPDPAARLHSRFLRLLARRGIDPAAGEGPLAFAARVSGTHPNLAAPVAAFTRPYLELRYCGADARLNLPQLRAALKALRKTR